MQSLQAELLTATVNPMGFHKFDNLLGNSPVLALPPTMIGEPFTLTVVRFGPFEYREMEFRNTFGGSRNECLRFDRCELTIAHICFLVL